MTDYAALKAELDADPLGLGYAGKPPAAIAELLNRRGVSGETVPRETVANADILGAIVASDLAALSAIDLQRLAVVLSPAEVPVTLTVKTVLAGLFPAGTATRANLITLANRPASRAEVLGWRAIAADDVARAT